MTAVRLNLGGGTNHVEGYDNTFDVKHGKKAYPLELPDGCADEVRASHLLEHFSHRGSEQVVKEWVRVLKPGGLLRLAVPDFEAIARKYTAGEPGQYQGWVSGGQVEPYDSHLAIFDHAGLADLMRRCGLIGIHKWKGEGDCSQLPISLNLAGYKRPEAWPKVIAVMSRPRLGWQDMFGCAMDELAPMGIPLYSRSGALWGKALTLGFDAALADKPVFLLTLDYDTLFLRDDVEDLIAFALAAPDVDALVPAQMTRVKGLSNPLLFNPKIGTPGITAAELDETYYPILTGHFGCTLLRVSALERLPKPWFFPSFKEDGTHEYDDDINFWLSFEKAGLKAVLTPRVVVGHLELFGMWPDRSLKIIHQRTDDFRENRKPKNVWR